MLQVDSAEEHHHRWPKFILDFFGPFAMISADKQRHKMTEHIDQTTTAAVRLFDEN